MTTDGKSNFRNLVFVLPLMFYQPGKLLKMLVLNQVSGWMFFLSFGIAFTLLASAARAFMGVEQVGDNLTLLFVHTISHLLSFWVTLIGGAALVARLSDKFGASAGFSMTFLATTFAYLPLLLAFILQAVLQAIPGIWMVGLVFAMILFWKGSEVLLGIPENRCIGFTFLAFFIFLGIGYLSAIFFDLITFAIFGIQ